MFSMIQKIALLFIILTYVIKTSLHSINLVPVRELSEDEKNTIQLQEDFRYFLDHSSRVIERALDEVDVDLDYSRTGDEDLSGQYVSQFVLCT